ncbi:MAG: Enoyl-[acyl-carrier-protein] reductase [NADH] FabI [Chlamydiia bacterium]|nr:Enoyl-[acyl-carrier-protein] reductase [NADH] FabI [Chlamydiia bacterium]
MLKVDLKGKKAFIAGIGDDQGFGWAIAKQLAEAGATILVGTWTPILKIFTTSLENGKFDASRRLSDGSMMQFEKVYALDASFDTKEDVPEEILQNKRYMNASSYTISEVAEAVQKDYGEIDILVHSLANAPEVKKPLLETSRSGYLAAHSNSSYSYVGLIKYFGPIMSTGGSCLTLTYIASERAIPGYGGGMSSAKAALESDTRTLAYEAGRKWGVRVNAISAGALSSRAARAIGDKGKNFIEMMIEYSKNNAPLDKDLKAEEIGKTAAYLCSSLSSAVTGVTLYVDNGLHAMGLSLDSPALEDLKASPQEAALS